MANESGSGIKLVLNAWAIVGIIVAISSGVTGAFLWLDKKFDLFALDAELEQVEIKLKRENCKLNIAVLLRELAEKDEALGRELDDLLNLMPTSENSLSLNSATARQRFTEAARKQSEICIIGKQQQCLLEKKNGCEGIGRLDQLEPDPCPSFPHKTDCQQHQACADLGGTWKGNECLPS